MILRLSFWVFTLSFLVPNTFAQPADILPMNAATLKVLSWNIYMLPPIVRRTGQLRRTKHIAEMLNKSDYDLVVFQEAFFKKSRELMMETLDSTWQYKSGPTYIKRGSLKANSGILFVSRLPFETIDSMMFKDCAGVDCRGRKGATLIEVNKGGMTYQVMGAHLDSDPATKDALVRIKQYHQIWDELVSENQRDGVPQILCADYNTMKREPQYYNKMLEVLNAKDVVCQGDIQISFDGSKNDLIKSTECVEHLDYILLRANGIDFLAEYAEIKAYQADWHKRGKKVDLADHYALEGIFTPHLQATEAVER